MVSVRAVRTQRQGRKLEGQTVQRARIGQQRLWNQQPQIRFEGQRQRERKEHKARAARKPVSNSPPWILT